MGYRTHNDESHVCVYCDTLIEKGNGVLLKYSYSQSDEAITVYRFTNRVGHEQCVNLHGSAIEQEALVPFQKYNKLVRK